MSGDPTLELTKRLVLEVEEKGPTIQKAGQRSLEHGINLTDIFALVKEIREVSQIPIILMGYYNSIFNYGLQKFVKKSEEVGVDGVIIPDLPLGEDKELRSYSSDLDIILLVAPSSIEDRIKEVATSSQGFIYAVSTSGTTGTRERLSNQIEGVVDQIKEITTTPVAVGFGISTPEHVKEIADFADGVIVGSAIIRRIEANLDLLPESSCDLINQVGQFISALKEPVV